MNEIRFKNLPYLLNDMNNKGWIIDLFNFEYKDIEYYVIFKIYKDNQKKPNKYAMAEVEFIKKDDIYKSIIGYMDFYEIKFNTLQEFCNFFEVQPCANNRNLFKDFSAIFANYIPRKKSLIQGEKERKLIGSRAESNNPNAIYCYDVRRNGIREKEDGSFISNQRSIENSNKARLLRPKLFERFKDEMNFSFFFSENENDEKTNEEIYNIVSNRR